MNYSNLSKEELSKILIDVSNALTAKNNEARLAKETDIAQANTRLAEINSALTKLFYEVETIVSKFDRNDNVTFYFGTPNGSSIEYTADGWYSSYD